MLKLISVSLLGLVPSIGAFAVAQAFNPAPGNFPARADGDSPGGIFCISLSDLPKYASAGGTGPEAPKGDGAKTCGSGPYPAAMMIDTSLPGHTIFAPKSPPDDSISLPFIAWGNGGCSLNAGDYEHLRPTGAQLKATGK